MAMLDSNDPSLEDKRLDESGESFDDEKQRSPAIDHAPLAQSEAPPRDINGWKWYSTLVSILTSTFLYALDATVVAELQPIIVQDLGGITKLSWLSGRIYGHFNAKWFYIFHVTLFEIGSAICGAAPSMNVMILGRAIASVGGSGLYVGCMTLIAMTTTISERPVYVSCTGFSWGLGIVLGPVIGGAFSESSVGWRWAFYINLFIGAVYAPFYIFLIPSKDPRPGASIRERSSELDYPGIVLQSGALAALILAINLGGVTYPWNSSRITMFVVSAALFITLGTQQVWTLGVPLSPRIIPVQFFRSRTVLLLFAATAEGGACAFIPIYMVPLFFHFTRNDGPLDAGVRLLPFVVVMVLFVFLNGNLMARLGYYMPWFLTGGVLIVAGSALMYTVDQDTSQGRVYGYSVLLGIGLGMFLQAPISVVQAVVEPENIAPAIGFITLAQFVGITVALAIGNAVLLNNSLRGIEGLLPDVPRADIQAAILGARSGLVRGLSEGMRTRVLDAIVRAIGDAYILTVAGGALVVVLSLAMRREKLLDFVAAYTSEHDGMGVLVA
ncbi:MFS general substrate transporter [Aspergillus steynii IBT 23096]|uniref:MFS general substrate transporter n=1 Tax=Aspergillus steynii IBT 23096 TaxID=1392250 RepID=A0A2I2FY24_9EURO|nr:MFS general substrate transporter [Aspergillus steynii IBT 23096]PLB45530.1 MFS general substrate transporter [Aspergillus steynii IBT 23096]